MTTAQKFDLVVIGSGPAAEKGAAQAAYFGKKVAVVERAAALGGACVHTGTLPSKTLREAALYLTGFQKRHLYGMTVEIDRTLSLRRIMGRLHTVIQTQEQEVRANLDRHGVALIHGEASFLSPSEVMVRAEGSDEIRLSGACFLIATGSSPHRPPGVPFSDPDVEDSDGILDLDRIPDALAVVGGGVIGCEYACLFAALGTRITLIERDRLIGALDSELSEVLRQALEQAGHQVLLGDAVERIHRVPAGPIHIELKSGRVLEVDKVLYSAGRAGNTTQLHLEQAGISPDSRGRILVDEHFQTSVPHIYAAGDVVGFPALASVSMEQGRVAVCHAFGFSYKTHVSPITPYGIFTIPEASMVGATENDLKKTGTPYEVGRARYAGNARGQIIGDTDGLLKLVFEVPTKRLLGVHIIGERATELVHIGQMVMEFGGTIDTFIDCVFNFPTLSEIYKYAAYDGLGRLARRLAPVA